MSKNNVKPEIRFKNFNDAWEQRKLYDYKDVRDGTHDSPKYYQFGHPLVTSKNLKPFGLDMTDISLISTKDFDAINKRSKVDKGDILFGMIGTIGNPVIIDRSDFAIKNVALIKEGGDITNLFLIQLLKSPVFDKYIRNENVGNTQKFIGLNKIRDFKFLAPNLEEQNKIAMFLKRLDNTIALHQHELTLLKQRKKAFLQKMFPKKEERTPDVRFSDFYYNWNNRVLGELVDISTGKLDANAMKENGEYDFYTSGIKKFKIDTFSFEGPAITIAGNGATVGYMHYADGKFNAYQRTYVLTNFRSIREFIYLEIERKLPRKIKKEARTGNIPYIVMEMLTNLEIQIPAIEEQEEIGNFFKQLDEDIELHEQKTKTLKQMKKAFLQKMFV